MKCALTLLILSLTLHNISAETVIEDKRQVKILTPSIAEQQTLKLRLDNNLEVYLISNPAAEKSGAVLSVRAGSFEDPTDHPGMAHFLEHMLFLGTAKYPAEGDFQRYVSDHGGDMNAFTTNYFTSYVFTVKNEAFAEALDRFSHFFIDPLLNPSGVSRELKAIDQEYAKNLEDDHIRTLYTHKWLANKQHPNQHFGMGNSRSLAKVKQEELRQWYNEHYSANLMRLVVTSPLPLEQLKKYVVNDFSGIPNKNRPQFSTTAPSTASEMEGKIVYIEPIKDIRRLMLVWELPAAYAKMKETKPESVLCYVLGHEGQESLLAELKRQKLADSLSCGGSKIGPDNMELFLLIELTEKGLQDVNKVILTLFQTLAGLDVTGVPQEVFKEIQRVETIDYQFQQPENLFLSLMTNGIDINDEEIATYPEQSKIIQKYDGKAIATLIKSLQPERAHYYIVAPAAKSKVAMDEKEGWLGVDYAVQDIPAVTMQQWTNAKPHPSIGIPKENPFIAHNFQVIASPSKNQSIIPQAKVVENTELGKFYAATDNTFLVPKVLLTFLLKTPEVNAGDSTKVALTDLYVKALTEAFSPYSYPAQMAGFDYEVKREDFGIRLTIEGYSDTADTLLNTLLKVVTDNNLQTNKFNVYKETLLREYLNSALNKPWEQISEQMKSILYKEFTVDKDKAVALRKITAEKFEEYTKELFKTVYVEGTLYGNIDDTEAKKIAQNVLDAFKNSSPYTAEKRPKRKIINLPGDKGPFMVKTKTAAQGNAALLAIESLPFSMDAYAVHDVLAQALTEPFFNELRTRQQTGYIVFSTAQELERHLFLFFVDQSNTHAPRDLMSRFELFIESFLQELESHSITKERFDSIKAGLIAKLQKPATTVNEMGTLINNLAFNYDGDFNWTDKRIAALHALEYDSFVAATKQILGKKNKRRIALLMRGTVNEQESLHYVPLKNPSMLRAQSTYSGIIDN